MTQGSSVTYSVQSSSLYNVCADPRLNHNPPFRHGVLAAECSALLSDFFAERR
jgi:tRNA(adenine34) deaminase